MKPKPIRSITAQPFLFMFARYLFITLALLSAPRSFAEDSAAVVNQLIERVSSELDKLYKAHRIDDRAAIEQMIRNEIVPHIDQQYLARRVYRQFWTQLTQAGKQQDAQQRVIDSIVKTYAVALSSYSGDTLSVISVKEEGNKSQARSRIRRPNGQTIQVDFMLSNNSGAWLINNMVVDGIDASLTIHNAIKPIWEQQGMEAGLNAVRESDAAVSDATKKK
ncbi:MAG: ABC transporter substrate-binding protein [Spongiibacteraceae bacterium]